MIVARTGTVYGTPDPAVVHARPGRLDRPSRLALAATQQVFREPLAERPRLGVWILSQYGAFSANAEHWLAFLAKGQAGVSPLVFPATVPSAAAAEIAMAIGAMGPNVTLCGGPAMAIEILTLATDAIARGECDEAIVGAVDGHHPRLAFHDAAVIDGAVVVRIGKGETFAAAPLRETTLRTFDSIVTRADDPR